MALDLATLRSQILAAFVTAKDTEPPADPADAAALQDEILEQLSTDLAAAIDGFVRGGQIAGITTDVVLDLPSETGTGTQSAPVNVQ